MKIILLGPPGSGTSTFSSILSPLIGLPHISSGNIFQENILKKTPLGIEIKELYEKGQLIPDDITIDLVIKRLKEPDCKNGFILDGFPRSVKQAEGKDRKKILGCICGHNFPIDKRRFVRRDATTFQIRAPDQ